MTSNAFPHPAVFGSSRSGQVFWLEGGKKGLEDALQSGETVVLKPMDGKHGKGIQFIRQIEDFHVPPQGDFIFTAFVKQAAYADAIFPGSLNTIRMLVGRMGEGEPLLIAASHRFGSPTSGGVDNFHAGGCNAPIDIVTGTLGKVVTVGAGNKLNRGSTHPGTGAPIEGVRIPQWERATALALELSRRMTGLGYVGWDIAVTDNGPTVIEGNSAPGATIHQLHAPLLNQPHSEAFFTRHLRPR